MKTQRLVAESLRRWKVGREGKGGNCKPSSVSERLTSNRLDDLFVDVCS